MLTQRRANRLSALSLTLVAGLAGFPLVLAYATSPEQTSNAAAEVQQPAGAPVAVLRGRVKSKEGVPLPGVRIRVAIPATDMRQIDPSRKLTVLEANSDANGDYRVEIPGLALRTKVSIDALMPGFERLVGTLMGGGDARTAEVVPGGAPAVADLALEPARYFAGTVVDEQGEPIPSVEIIATLQHKQFTAYVEVTATNPNGSFEIFGYPEEALEVDDEKVKGVITFSHPNFTEFQVKDIDEIDAKRTGALRIVLPTGRKLTGKVLDIDGKPVDRATIEAIAKNGTVQQRKAVVTDAEGKFTLRGLIGGPTTLTAQALPIKQNARLSIPLDADNDGLQVRLQPITMPANLKKYAVLGMQLADATPELKLAYDLNKARGAVILDPGPDHERLKIGELAEGNTFWLVGEKRVGSVREFVSQILEETGGRDAEEYSIRVAYNFKRTEMTGSNTQYLKVTREDIKQLQALADQLKAETR
jgi:uncharacterized GH25 family protein